MKYKLVPIEPTPEMRRKAGLIRGADYYTITKVWRAMIDASPAVQGDPVGMVKTVGGYPDESKHTIEWLCKYKELKNGDLLYTTPDVAQPVAVPEIIKAVANFVGSQKGGPFTPAVMKAAIIDELEYGNTFTKLYTALQPTEQQGHVHARLMELYAEDAKTTDKPWFLWQLYRRGEWQDLQHSPQWGTELKYRRKPRTHVIHGVDIPDLRVSPEYGEYFYLADPLTLELTNRYEFDSEQRIWVERGFTYQDTEEGKQAAILHAKAMLGIK